MKFWDAQCLDLVVCRRTCTAIVGMEVCEKLLFFYTRETFLFLSSVTYKLYITSMPAQCLTVNL